MGSEECYEGNGGCYEKVHSKWWCSITHVLCSITIVSAENNEAKIAFIRHHDLWIKVDGKEKQLTKGEYITGPKWSHDGEWIAYAKGKKQNTLELYRLEDGKKVRPLQSEVSNYQWSPKENVIAFVFANTLNTFDVQKEY